MCVRNYRLSEGITTFYNAAQDKLELEEIRMRWHGIQRTTLHLDDRQKLLSRSDCSA